MMMYVYTYRIERNWMLSMLMNTCVGTSRKWKCPSYLNSFHVKSQNAKLWCQSQRAKIINEISQSYKSLTFSFDEIVCLNPMISIVSYPSLFSCTTSGNWRESSWRRHACPGASWPAVSCEIQESSPSVLRPLEVIHDVPWYLPTELPTPPWCVKKTFGYLKSVVFKS